MRTTLNGEPWRSRIALHLKPPDVLYLRLPRYNAFVKGSWKHTLTRWLFAPVLSGPAMPIKEITNPLLPIVRSGNLCKSRGPCVLSADVVSLLISSFKLLAHPSSLVSWGFWLFVPYSDVIPCHGGFQPPFTGD